MKPSFASLTRHVLDDQSDFYTGSLPSELIPTSDDFEAIWRLHPVDFHVITMHGRPVPTPRWQQAYGHDYHYTGRVNRALPVPDLLQPISDWADRTIFGGLNGVLINWYDGTLGHYIGRHRDSMKKIDRWRADRHHFARRTTGVSFATLEGHRRAGLCRRRGLSRCHAVQHESYMDALGSEGRQISWPQNLNHASCVRGVTGRVVRNAEFWGQNGDTVGNAEPISVQCDRNVNLSDPLSREELPTLPRFNRNPGATSKLGLKTQCPQGREGLTPSFGIAAHESPRTTKLYDRTGA